MNKEHFVEETLPYHNMKKEQVMEHFQTTPNGLTTQEVRERQTYYGKNELEEAEKDSILDIFLNQFKDILVIILIFAAFISGIVLEDFTDAILIGVILILNAIFGVYQEWRADKAIEALKRMVSHTCVVIRDDKEIEIQSNDLVPGDVVIFKQGDRIPADGRIIEAQTLRTEEAQLTGESTEVNKSSFTVVKLKSSLGDRVNCVYMGTHVTFGKGKAVVTNIGMKTEVGKIAGEVQAIVDDQTPTQIKLEKFGKKLGLIIIGIMVIILIYGIQVAKLEPIEMFEIAVSLAVAAIPEGLVIVITLALSLGVIRMAKKKAIVKKLPAVESLGSVTTICTDKTGTLTLNQMRVQKIAAFDNSEITIQNGDEFKNASPLDGTTKYLSLGLFLCNNASITDENVIGAPTELALLRLADELGIDRVHESTKYQRLDEIPFDSERKRMTIVVEDKTTKEKISFTKGAPEVLLSLADSIDLGNGPEPLTAELKEKVQKVIDSLASQALRVLGFGYYKLASETYNIYEFESKLIINGLVGLIDPPKPGVKETIEKCHTAGIRVVMVTGDHKNTAVAIGKDIGIYKDGDEVIDGVSLDEISDYELQTRIKNITIFARISPTHKLRIVRALKAKGEIVAMTGDGVNDAPALKGADVGIAMGSGTDVTKETADLILEDDNFTTIVHAVEEGRAIYDNMTKFIRYMLSSNLAEIIVIFLSIIITKEPALVATQILWINLVTDGVPALALGVDPASKNIMKRQPRDPNENLLAKDRIFHILLFGGYISLITLGSFILFLTPDFYLFDSSLSNDQIHLKASTIAFAILSLSQFAHALNVREDLESIIGPQFFKNNVLILTVFVSVIFQVFVIQGDVILSNLLNKDVDVMLNLFKTIPLSGQEWLFVGIVSSSLILYAEILKIIKRKTRLDFIC
ncbi:MAG: cation-translocating P-type ATPase [Candidatus Heimdallarchaeota archaeon]|nr:cation-translocating P-type ATPase [Candidatus Heimdallarchaeota archaeon]